MSCLDAEEKGVSILWIPYGSLRKCRETQLRTVLSDLDADERGVHTVDTLRRTENDPGDLRSAVIGLASAMIAVQEKMVLPLKRVCRKSTPLAKAEKTTWDSTGSYVT